MKAEMGKGTMLLIVLVFMVALASNGSLGARPRR